MTRLRRHELGGGPPPDRTYHYAGRIITTHQTGVGTWRVSIDGVELGIADGRTNQYPTAWNAYQAARAHLDREATP